MEDDNNVLVSIGLGLTTSLIQAGKEGNKFDPGIMGATALGTLTTIFLKKQIKAFRKRKAYKRKLQKNHSTWLIAFIPLSKPLEMGRETISPLIEFI